MMKQRLLRDVASFCQRNDRLWSKPIVDTLRDFRNANIRAVFFGGMLRSLLLSRIETGKFGRPRDIDIVITGTSIDELRCQFKRHIIRETRFGGLQMKFINWQFDVWPLHNTWALRQNQDENPKFGTLPYTTFFNLEAIAVDVWPQPGKKRRIYSGDDQFFNGLADRVLEINVEENPFPILCVVRALIFASSTGFAIGPKLANYIANHAQTISDNDLESVQYRHYGNLKYDMTTMRKWLEYILENLNQENYSPIVLPPLQQLPLWSNFDQTTFNLHVFNVDGLPSTDDSST